MPERLTGLAFVSIGYSACPLSWNQLGVEAPNGTQADLGYPIFGILVLYE